MVELRLMREIVCFITRNKGAFLLSAGIICISFLGTMVALLLASKTAQTNIQNYPGAYSSLGELNWTNIFLHNLVVLSPVVLGVFTFGFVSLWYMIWQSYLLGHAIYYSCQLAPPLTVLKYTVPHGIFEFLAMCFAGTFALKPFIVTSKSILFDEPFISKRDLRDMGILLFLFHVFLLIAAFVEAFVTIKL
jgi:stage II sporulation protein M